MGLYRRIDLTVTVLLLLLWAPPAWSDTGESTTTLTIDPSATAGTTITAADVNDRSNDTSTWANAHIHDLDNTTNFGDASAGNKQLCADAADTTDACIRWDDTANLWLVDNPTPGTFNQIVTMSGTSGITSGALLQAAGTGSVTGTTTASGTVLISQGTNNLVGLVLPDDHLLASTPGEAPAARLIPNCTDTGGNHLNYNQSTNTFSCGTTSTTGRFLMVTGDGTSRTADVYWAIGTAISNATEGNVRIFSPAQAFTLTDMECNLGSGGAPGAGNSWVFTINISTVASALSCTISNTSTNCSDTGESISVGANDDVTLFQDATGPPSGSVAQLCTIRGNF